MGYSAESVKGNIPSDHLEISARPVLEPKSNTKSRCRSSGDLKVTLAGNLKLLKSRFFFCRSWQVEVLSLYPACCRPSKIEDKPY